MVENRCNNASVLAESVRNYPVVQSVFWGDNAFMLVADCSDPSKLKMYLEQRGTESATHFAHCIEWAEEFGYERGLCPEAEYLVNHSLMIPTY